jgi:hypothetical protein
MEDMEDASCLIIVAVKSTHFNASIKKLSF